MHNGYEIEMCFKIRTGKSSKGHSVESERACEKKKNTYGVRCYDSSANQWVFAKEVTECLDSTSSRLNSTSSQLLQTRLFLLLPHYVKSPIFV